MLRPEILMFMFKHDALLMTHVTQFYFRRDLKPENTVIDLQGFVKVRHIHFRNMLQFHFISVTRSFHSFRKFC